MLNVLAKIKPALAELLPDLGALAHAHRKMVRKERTTPTFRRCRGWICPVRVEG
jgi:hypothetical protein